VELLQRHRPGHLEDVYKRQVRIFGQPGEIAVAEGQRPFQGRRRLVQLPSEGMAAGEIVEDNRAVRLELGQLLVHLQAVVESSTLGVMISQDLQRLHILRITADQPLQEGNL